MNTQPDLWSTAEVRTRGSDHAFFYFIRLYKKYPRPGSVVVSVDTEKNKTKFLPCVCMGGAYICTQCNTWLMVLG